MSGLDIQRMELIGEIERLRAAISECADRFEEDRREPDKILCHVLTLRRAVISR